VFAKKSGGLSSCVRAERVLGRCGYQYGSGLHEQSELGGEPGGGRAVDDVVVDGEGEVEDVPHCDSVTDSAWTFADSTDDDDEGRQGGRGDGEAAAVSEHANRGYLHRAGGEVDVAGAAHRRVHHPVQAGNPPNGGSDGVQQMPGRGGGVVGLDRPELDADLGDAADVGIADDVHHPEGSLAGGHLDQRLNVDVTMFDQPAAPVTVGVHLRVGRGCPAERRDDECGERQRRVVLGEQAPGGGDVDIEEPVHRHDAPAGADRRGHQPTAGREGSHRGAALPHGSRAGAKELVVLTTCSVGGVRWAHDRRPGRLVQFAALFRQDNLPQVRPSAFSIGRGIGALSDGRKLTPAGCRTVDPACPRDSGAPRASRCGDVVCRDGPPLGHAMNPPVPADVWSSGEQYEPYVGRWSRLVARDFVTWLNMPVGARWLDVGCGTGALSDAILRNASPSHVLGVDPSLAFIDFAGKHVIEEAVSFSVGNAQQLEADDGSFDAAVSGLVLNFVPDWHRAVSEMKRVAFVGGVVAAYVWDYPDEMWLIRHFWDAAVDLDPTARELHEGRRFAMCRPAELETLFNDVGLVAVESRGIVIPTVFESFDNYWGPFLGGQAPAPSYLRSLNETRRTALREAVRARLPISEDGSIHLTARAWAVRGRA
jgi:SAM-dependent methyltransferase